jgi:signal peptidase I
MENEKKFLKLIGINVFELLKIAVIALVIVAPIRYFLFQPFIVSGESMYPNFESGDYLIIDEISYRFSEPRRGDVVVFDASFLPQYKGQKFIKRVIGLPGEKIAIVSGKVLITDKSGKIINLSEKYLPKNLETFPDKLVSLSNGQYFVMGDNREFSYDSRSWGVLEENKILGKAALRLLPLTEISLISNPNY